MKDSVHFKGSSQRPPAVLQDRLISVPSKSREFTPWSVFHLPVRVYLHLPVQGLIKHWVMNYDPFFVFKMHGVDHTWVKYVICHRFGFKYLSMLY